MIVRLVGDAVCFFVLLTTAPSGGCILVNHARSDDCVRLSAHTSTISWARGRSTE